MKRATIRQRRTLADGRKFVNVVCPICQHRHWIPDGTATSQCPRRPDRAFTLTERTKR